MRPLNRHRVVGYREALLRIHRELAQYLLGVLHLPLSDINRPDGIERLITKLHQEEPPERLVEAPSIVLRLARLVSVEPSPVEVIALLLDILGYPDVTGERLVESGLQFQSNRQTPQHGALLRYPDQ